MKKIVLLFSVLVLLAASGQAQRHYVARGRGGYGYHGGGYHYARPYYGGYGRSYLGFGLGLGLGLYLNSGPYYGYGYGYPYAYPVYPAYPPAYAYPPQQQYQYSNPPAYDSTGRAPQQNNPNNKDGGYNQDQQQGNGPVADNDNTQGPKPTKSWIDSHWERRSSGWVWVEGYWKYN